jgi:hypothetical protein
MQRNSGNDRKDQESASRGKAEADNDRNALRGGDGKKQEIRAEAHENNKPRCDISNHSISEPFVGFSR